MKVMEMQKKGVLLILSFALALGSCHLFKGSSTVSREEGVSSQPEKDSPPTSTEEIGETADTDYLGEIARLISAGHLDRARDVVEALLKENPQEKSALYLAAMLENLAGREKRRDAFLERLLKVAPEDEGGNALRGDALFAERQYQEASRYYAKALRSNPSSLRALRGQARSFIYLGKSKEALELLDRVGEAVPEDPYVHVDRSRAFAAMKRYRRADKELTEAIRLDPHSEWHYLDRARLRLRDRRRPDLAKKDLLQLEKINPNNFFTHVYLAGIYDEMREYEEALIRYKRVLEMEKTYVFAHAPLGKIYYIRGDWEKAAYHFGRADEKGETDFGYLLAEAMALKRLGKNEKARALLEKRLPRFKKGTTVYEIYRYLAEEGSDYYVMNQIGKEKDEMLKNKALFYVGALSDLKGQSRTAAAIYEALAAKRGAFEFTIAAIIKGKRYGKENK